MEKKSNPTLNSDNSNTQNITLEPFTINTIWRGAEKPIQTDDFKEGELICILGGSETMISQEFLGPSNKVV